MADQETEENVEETDEAEGEVEEIQEVEEEPQLETPSSGARLLHFFALFWRTFLIVTVPLLWLCIFFSGDKNRQALCCFYVTAVMLSYWFTGALPAPVTGSLPHLLFPLMNILDSAVTSLQYMKESSFLILMEYVVAAAISNCKIHTYLLLKMLLLTGASHARLSLILCIASASLACIVSRTPAALLLLPFVTSLLEALDEEGAIDLIERGQTKDISHPVPSKIVLGYFLTVMYGANIGAMGTVYGAPNNLIARQMVLEAHPEMKYIEYQRWLVAFILPMALNLLLTWLWLNFLFFWRDVHDISEEIYGVIEDKNYTMEPLPTQMICVFVILVLLLACLMLRVPVFFPGLQQMFRIIFKPIEDTMKIEDSAFFILLFFILYMLPGTSSFKSLLSSEKLGRPKQHEAKLLPWKKTEHAINWGLLYLIGGGYAVQEGMRQTGAMSMLETFMKNFEGLPNLVVLIVICVLILLLTQTLPEIPLMLFFGTVSRVLSKVKNMHAVYLVVPAAVCTSMQLLFPWSSEASRYISKDFKIPVHKMVIAGIVPLFVCPTITVLCFCTLGNLVFQI